MEYKYKIMGLACFIGGMFVGLTRSCSIDPINSIQMYPTTNFGIVAKVNNAIGYDFMLVKDPNQSTRYIRIEDYLNTVNELDRGVREAELERTFKLLEDK